MARTILGTHTLGESRAIIFNGLMAKAGSDMGKSKTHMGHFCAFLFLLMLLILVVIPISLIGLPPHAAPLKGERETKPATQSCEEKVGEDGLVYMWCS